MAVSDEEVERLWEGEEEEMDEEDKDWLIQRLREKVHDLKEQLRLVSTFGHGSIAAGGGSGPLAHVVFFNNVESMSNRHRVETLVRSLANSVRDSQIQVEALTHYHQPSAVLINSTVGEDGESEESEEGEEEEGEEVCVVGSVEYYVDFCLDWRGVPVREVGGGVNGGKRVEWKPSDDTAVLYGQVYLEPFWVDVVREREVRRLRRMGIACFNCGDDHHIKDCPEPKDYFRINARRQEFLGSLGTQGADRRYHMTSGDDRFKKFVPGKISAKLRKALGLMNETDYPPYIYRMRTLDYPPGYRILARERGLRMYDNPDDAKDKENEDTVKKEDVIIYPGFNSPDVSKSTAPSYKLSCGGPPTSHVVPQAMSSEGDKNKEKLKQWLSAADSAHQKKAGPATNEEGDDVDDLGTLSDYEFEEAEMTEDGEEVVVGFGLRKLLKTIPQETNEDQTTPPPSTGSTTTTKPRKKFSLDFPPGLVHDESECIKSPKRWKEIKKILETKNKKKPVDRKELRKRLLQKLCD